MISAALPLEKKIMVNKYSLDNLKEIQSDINSFLVEYENESKGPAKTEILAKEMPKLLNKLMKSAARNNREKIDKIDSEYKLKLQEMETKTGMDKDELERLRDSEKLTKEKVNSNIKFR